MERLARAIATAPYAVVISRVPPGARRGKGRSNGSLDASGNDRVFGSAKCDDLELPQRNLPRRFDDELTLLQHQRWARIHSRRIVSLEQPRHDSIPLRLRVTGQESIEVVAGLRL